MLEARWLALGVFATICLFLWLIVLPDRRVYFTAGFSGLTYGAMALTAPGVEKMTETGETVPAPIEPTIQYFVAVLGVVCFAVLWAYNAGEYPPEQNNEQ